MKRKKELKLELMELANRGKRKRGERKSIYLIMMRKAGEGR